MAFGINTLQEQFDEEISQIASSIKNEFAMKVDNQAIIAEFCQLFEKKLEQRRCFKKKVNIGD